MNPQPKEVASRLLVVDATVIRAAGDSTEYPISTTCRDILKDILDICHRCAINKQLRTEWLDHASRYARLWLVQMNSRGKIRYLPESDPRDFSNRILDALPSQQKKVAYKDLHLIIAAHLAEKIVISQDKRARGAFAACCHAVAELAVIQWLDPAADGERIRMWLSGEGEPQAEWSLAPRDARP